MLPASRVIGHREYGNTAPGGWPGRKSDPTYDMNWRRARVAAFKPRSGEDKSKEWWQVEIPESEIKRIVEALLARELSAGDGLPKMVFGRVVRLAAGQAKEAADRAESLEKRVAALEAKLSAPPA